MTPAEIVAAVRAFNRFYTQRIGVVGGGHLHSPFSLGEVRVLWELAHRSEAPASDLARDLAVDPAYVSRTVRLLQKRRLLVRRPSPDDKRQAQLALTARGRSSFALLDARA